MIPSFGCFLIQEIQEFSRCYHKRLPGKMFNVSGNQIRSRTTALAKMLIAVVAVMPKSWAG